MASVVVTVLSMTIGFFFILIGTMNLTPAINEEVYREMRKGFIRNVKVFPFAEYTGWRPNPHNYRKVIATTQVVCGLILAIIPGPLKQFANIILFIIMCAALHTHWALKDGMDKMTPALVFGLLLACRYIVHLQIKAREQKQAKEAAEKAAEVAAAEEPQESSEPVPQEEEKKTQ